MKKSCLLPLIATALSGWCAPAAPEELQLRAAFPLAFDAALSASSTFNPRYFGDEVYVNQINNGTSGFGRYESGSEVPLITVNNTAENIEHRMVAPFRAPNGTRYILGSSSGATSSTTFSRYDFDGQNRVDAPVPDGFIVEGYDWVDENTVIYTVYTSGNRKKLYLADVVAEPFAINLNTAWNPNGYIDTGVSTRIRNVRVGDQYRGFAYYGDSGQNTNPNFFALNLATGAETLLGNAGALTGTGSFGIWTVVERGGYLYVQTTDNGIQVYRLNSATTLGELAVTYSKEALDAVTGYSGQYYGLDVTPDGRRMLLGASQGKVFELGPPRLWVTRINTDLEITWPVSVTAVVLQSTTSSTLSGFADIDPQPAPTPGDKFNTVWVPLSDAAGYFRLRRAP